MAKSHIVENCPKCGAIDRTFNANHFNDCSPYKNYDDIEYFEDVCSPYDKCKRYELLTVCDICHHAITFILAEHYDGERDEVITSDPPMNMEGLLNGIFEIEGIVRLCDNVARPTPEFIPRNIKATFKEGAECLSIQCWNAAGTIFRTCIDLTTKDQLAKKHHGKSLLKRIDCFFEEGKLSSDLKDLANCIRKDGNDGAHDATLTKYDAMDLFDFTMLFLENVYTNPNKIKNAVKRHAERKAKNAKPAPVKLKRRLVKSKPVPAKLKRRPVKPASVSARPIVERNKSKLPLDKRISIRAKAKDVPPPE